MYGAEIDLQRERETARWPYARTNLRSARHKHTISNPLSRARRSETMHSPWRPLEGPDRQHGFHKRCYNH